MHSTFLLDKTISVKPNHIAKTAYVHIDNIKLGCKDTMSIGDIKNAYELVKQNAPNQMFPCPVGYWDKDRFVIVDGRHTVLALQMNGFEWILVAWEEEVNN